MTEIQILCLFILFAIANIRPLVFRQCSVNSNPVSTTSMVSLWMFLGVIILYPFYGYMLKESVPTLLSNPYLIFVGLLKGMVLWIAGYIGQYLRSKSNSSTAYAKQVSIGGIAVVNAMQGEVLLLPQWIAVISLVCLGVAFSYKGHISELPAKYKLAFIAMICICIIPASADYAVISKTNWYTLMTMVAISMLTITTFKLKRFSEVKKLFSSKSDVMAGSIILLTEIAIMMILVTHVSVTMGVLTMSLSVPTMMVVSSLFWKEGNWKQQLIFGSLGYISMIPMVLL